MPLFFVPSKNALCLLVIYLRWEKFLIVMKKKIESIQAARAIAANMVLLFHMMSSEQKYGHGLHVLPIFCQAGAWSVDLFFMISGFIMATVSCIEKPLLTYVRERITTY